MASDKLTIHSEISIAAPQQKVFDLLTDPRPQTRIMPGLIEVSNVPTPPMQVGSTWDYRYQMYGVELKGRWEVTKIVTPTIYDGQTSGDVKSVWHYELQERIDGTHVSLTIDYEPPQTVIGGIQVGILKRINEKSAETFMQNLKLILEPLG